MILSFRPLAVSNSLSDVSAGLSVNDALLPPQVTLTAVSDVGSVALFTSDTVESETWIGAVVGEKVQVPKEALAGLGVMVNVWLLPKVISDPLNAIEVKDSWAAGLTVSVWVFPEQEIVTVVSLVGGLLELAKEMVEFEIERGALVGEKLHVPSEAPDGLAVIVAVCVVP